MGFSHVVWWLPFAPSEFSDCLRLVRIHTILLPRQSIAVMLNCPMRYSSNLDNTVQQIKCFCLLDQIVGAFLGYIGVAKSESAPSFAELARVFEITLPAKL